MTTPREQRGALSQMDRELERHLRFMLDELKLRPERQAISREDLIWIIGALVQQRERICTVLRQAHDDLESSGCGNESLLTLMRSYATIRQII